MPEIIFSKFVVVITDTSFPHELGWKVIFNKEPSSRTQDPQKLSLRIYKIYLEWKNVLACDPEMFLEIQGVMNTILVSTYTAVTVGYVLN